MKKSVSNGWLGMGFSEACRGRGSIVPVVVAGLLIAVAGVVMLAVAGMRSDGTVQAERDAIYDSTSDGRAQLEAAIAQAKKEGKRVLVQWGANWCGWCHRLHAYFEENAEARALLDEHYVVVLIDSDTNKPLMRELGVKPRGIPYLSVFSADGHKLVDQDTGSLETGARHDPEKVNPFLRRWRAPDAEVPGAPAGFKADELLAAATADAKETDRRILVVLGTEWCGWCRRLESMLKDEAIHSILKKHYVVVHLDQEKTPGAKAFREANAADGNGGVPWFAIADASRTVLATSDAESGNVGCPVKPAEVAHFLSVIEQTAPTMPEKERAALGTAVRRVAATF